VNHVVLAKLALTIIALLLTLMWPAVFVAPINAISTAPPQQWSRTFPRTLNYSVNGYSVSVLGDEGRFVVQTTEGGYAVFAALDDHHYEPHSGGVDNRTSAIIKTDSLGNVQWQKSVSGISYPYSIFQTKDSGFILSADNSLVKLDADGTLQWSKNFGSYFVSIQSSDGSYILAGSTNSISIDDNIANLIKTDESGNILWNRTYRDSGWSRVSGVVETSGGGYALAGQRSGSWFGLINSEGNLVSSRNYPDLGGYFNSVARTTDGGFVLVGGNSIGGISNQGQAFIVKVDSQGAMQWNHSYNNPPSEGFWFSSVAQTVDGGYVAIGPSAIFKINSSGSLQWYASSNTDVENFLGSTDSVAATNDGGFIVSGSKSNSVWLAKYAPESPSSSPTQSPNSSTNSPSPYASLSPNPSPSPSIPEFPPWIILSVLLIGAILLFIQQKFQKNWRFCHI
jgi:hypothetical protein